MYFKKKKKKKKFKKSLIGNLKSPTSGYHHKYFEYFTQKNTASSIFVQFLKNWSQNIQKSNYKKGKIYKK